MMGWLIMAAVGLISGATGFAVPVALLHGPKLPDARNSRGTLPTGKVEKGHYDSPQPEAPNPSTLKQEAAANQPAFLPFGNIVVNLAEENLTRYLRVTLILQVDPAHEEAVKRALDRNKTILKNWLIGYLSDKELDEVRGAVGVNKARREIQDQFNRLLFPDGNDLIQDILFEEFTVT
jgi:flagellar basal body-associated protein FliL